VEVQLLLKAENPFAWFSWVYFWKSSL